MAVIVKNLETTQDTHSFDNFYGFIDSDKNVCIIGDEGTIIDLTSSLFCQYNSNNYNCIEDFLDAEFGTKLVKTLENSKEFDIEIILK